MSERDDRDAETAAMIRKEIDELVYLARKYNWSPTTNEWHRAFGELSGMHRILQLIDPNADDIKPLISRVVGSPILTHEKGRT